MSKYLDGKDLAAALASGIHSVIRDQETLNRINVFPVADGDTGTNLALTLSTALPLLDDQDNPHLGTLLAAVADALLDGARGNSGAIIAQFFQGMSDAAGDLTRFTTYTFSAAVRQGSDYAHDALSEPREGTILTVIAAFSDTIAHQVSENREGDFRDLLRSSLAVAERALADTTSQLDVLKKAGVVDAGAKGFVDLFTGITSCIADGQPVHRPDLGAIGELETMIRTAGIDEDTEFRFCTECIVTATDIDRRKLREALAELGDSLVLAGTKRKAKIHIHVNEPEAVFELARRHGRVSGEKADDMHRQSHSTHSDKRRFAVITDSAADIPDEDLERLDIHMVPVRIQFGDRGFLDKVSITNDEFFAELASNPNHPTTSQPSPGDFRRQFQFLASHYPDVLSINLTRIASGTFEAARAAAERVDARGEVRVIDSRNASLGEGMLAVFAAECADAGLDIETTVTAIQPLLYETRTFGLIEDLRFAVRGGRIPGWVKTVADLLRLQAIIRTYPDGRVASGRFQVGRRNKLRRFARYVARKSVRDRALHVAVGHALNPDGAEQLAELLRDEVENIARLNITEIGSALGVHAGPGTLVVATQPQVDPRNLGN